MATKKCDKQYLLGDGTLSRSVTPEAVGMRFAFANGQNVDADPSQFPEGIIKSLILHGLSQKVGDSYSGEPDVEKAIEAAEGILENLQEGRWSDRREGSGIVRTSILAEAVQRAKPEKYPTIADAVKAVGEWDDDFRKNAAKVGVIAKHMEDIKAERAAARAEKAAKEVDSNNELLDQI